jgi:ppGpp synthetase/RelA/SpoT-type nucleotidyltranferase
MLRFECGVSRDPAVELFTADADATGSDPPPMPYEKPPCSLNQIDRAGKKIFDSKTAVDELPEPVTLIWNWRAAHSYPLNALHMTLRNRARDIDINALTAQRLKRLDSILRKLKRRPTVQLSQMQDIGGCRAVVSNMNRLNMLSLLYQTKPLRHELNRVRDYIIEPKEDGYRSIHFMYRFRGNATSLPWDKLRIEIQLRTKLQHAWATSVETVDAFTGEDLKFGAGSSAWRRFFELMGSVHARIEKTELIPGTPQTHEGLLEEVRELEAKLQVIHQLRSYAHLTQHITGARGQSREWFVVQMLPAEGRVSVRSYPLSDFEAAKQLLAETERQFEGTRNQVVLVAVASLRDLKRAYPNYFADTAYFTSILEKVLNGETRA